MTFECEDLRGAGLVLVPASSPDYEPLLKDIQERMDHLPAGPPIMPEQLHRMMYGKISPEKRSSSAILINRSEKSIAALELVWHCEEVSGRTYTGSSANTFGAVLLMPISSQVNRKLQVYWNTIMPGSKRYLAENEMAGDNTDVRMPDEDEIWKGGGFAFGSGGGGRNQRKPIKSVTLAIDGAFFSDGEFVGPNQYGLWESITSEAKTRLDIAKMARDGKGRGLAAAEILSEIGKVTGPSLDHPGILPPPLLGPMTPEKVAAINRRTEQMIANNIDRQRQSWGDDRTVDMLAAEADTQLPTFRRC